jgi:hypothetical protein
MTFMPVDKSDGCGTGSRIAAGGERCALLELSVGYGLILITVWTPRPWQSLLSWAALVWVLLATGISFDGWSAMGLRIPGSMRSLWVIGAALLLAAAAVTVAARLNTLQLPVRLDTIVKRYWGYAIWTFLQEFLLLDFFLLRLLRLLPERKAAAIAAAGLFALAHLPNPILTLATLIWGFVACRLFLQYRNVYILAMAHAILGICISVTVPGSVHHNMRVGLGYLFYSPPDHHHRSQKDHIVSTVAWVITAAPTRRS